MDHARRRQFCIEGSVIHEGVNALYHGIERHAAAAQFDPSYELQRFAMLRRAGYAVGAGKSMKVDLMQHVGLVARRRKRYSSLSTSTAKLEDDKRRATLAMRKVRWRITDGYTDDGSHHL
jgi:hypothetical protein